MTAASPKSSPAMNNNNTNTPYRATGANSPNHNSNQIGGVFGKCTEPIPTTTASVRQQQQAAQRVKTSLSNNGAKFVGNEDGGYADNKTVSKPHKNALLKKKAGSKPLVEVTLFSPADPTVHNPRTTQQHTDPFSEERIRAEPKKRKVLVPESSTKDPHPISIRVSENTKAKWESPFAADDASGSFNNNNNSPNAMSPTRSSAANSPQQLGKRCARTQEGSAIFTPQTEEESSSRQASLQNAANNNSRFKFSSQGATTMHNELTEAEISKDRNHHKKVVNAPQTTMEGVFTVVEKKLRHPHYKIHAPFARQGSIAASARIGGRRHKKNSEAVSRGEVVSPYANGQDATQQTPAPNEFNARPRKVFNEKHSDKTPFARHNSLPPKGDNFVRRVFKQKPTSPFATHDE